MWIRNENGEIKTDAHGKKFWIDNFLMENFKFVKTKVQHKIPHRRSDLFVIVDGPVGSGKSTLSFQCAQWFDPTFNLSRVVFSVEDFLGAIIRAKPGEAVVFDEAIIVNSRSALTEFNKKIIIAMTQIRSKGLYIFFNIPSVFDLDKNLVLNRCHLLLHCFQNRFGDRGKYIVFDNDKLKLLYLKGKKLYTYGFPKANFTGNFKEYFCLPRPAYEKKKQKEIAAQAITKKAHRWTLQRNNLIVWMMENSFQEENHKKRFELISEITKGLSVWQVEDIFKNGATLED